MTNPTILFVKPKAVSTKDKSALRKAGVIVVEVENPADVKLVKANAELSGSALLLAATRTIAQSEWPNIRTDFGKAVCAALEAAGKPEDGTP